MKKYFYLPSTIIFSMIIFYSCKKTDESTTLRDFEISNKGRVQVYNGIIGTSASTSRIFMFVGGNPTLGGVQMPSFSVSPSIASYLMVEPGSASFTVKDSLTTTTQLPLTFTETIASGKSYSIFVYDTLTSPKKTIVENKFEAIPDTNARIRLANLIYSKSGSPAVDVFSKTTGTNIFSNVASGQVTDFVNFRSNYADTVYFFRANTKDTLLTVLGLSVSQKGYATVAFRGSVTTKSATTRGLSIWSEKFNYQK